MKDSLFPSALFVSFRAKRRIPEQCVNRPSAQKSILECGPSPAPEAQPLSERGEAIRDSSLRSE